MRKVDRVIENGILVSTNNVHFRVLSQNLRRSKQRGNEHVVKLPDVLFPFESKNIKKYLGTASAHTGDERNWSFRRCMLWAEKARRNWCCRPVPGTVKAVDPVCGVHLESGSWHKSKSGFRRQSRPSKWSCWLWGWRPWRFPNTHWWRHWEDSGILHLGLLFGVISEL